MGMRHSQEVFLPTVLIWGCEDSSPEMMTKKNSNEHNYSAIQVDYRDA